MTAQTIETTAEQLHGSGQEKANADRVQLALVYETPSEEIIRIGAAAGEVSPEVANRVWRAMLGNSAPTIVAGAAPTNLALNPRSLEVMAWLDGLGPNGSTSPGRMSKIQPVSRGEQAGSGDRFAELRAHLSKPGFLGDGRSYYDWIAGTPATGPAL